MIPPRSWFRLVSIEGLSRLPEFLGWVGMAILTLWGANARFQIPAIGVAEWDSWGWLNPALNWLGSAGFREQFEREWLYGAFIAACLRITDSFSGYIAIQQTLGLLAGVLIWLTWRSWASLFPRNLFFQTVATLIGLLVVSVYLFSPIALALELSIRPEAIMAFVAFVQLYCITNYCKFRWHEPRPIACAIFGALAILFAYALFVLKPNWLLALLATTLPVFLGVFGTTTVPWSLRLLAPGLGLLLVVTTLLLPEKVFFIPSMDTRLVLPMTLFTIHADVIHENMKSELADQTIQEERRQFLEKFLPLFDQEMQTARTLARYYPRLGFDPDYLMYRSPLFPFLENTSAMSRREIANFCRTSFLSAIWNRPLDYARKLFTQLGYFFFPDDATFFRKRIHMGKLYEYVLTTVPPTLDEAINQPTRDLYKRYRERVELRAAQSDVLEVVRPFATFLRLVAAAAFFIEIAFLLALAACLVFRSLAPFRLPGLVALIFFLAPAGNALTIALIHALDNSRYRGSYGPLLLFALCALFFFALTIFAYTAKTICRRHCDEARS